MRKVSIKTARGKADQAMSIYIRTKYAVDGYCTCVTCGAVKPISETDAGHFIPKSRGASVRYVEENCHPQCQSCNRFGAQYAQIAYTQWMEETYGKGKIEELKDLSRELVRYRISDYKAFEAHYNDKLGEL